jgi:hypothetical protein
VGRRSRLLVRSLYRQQGCSFDKQPVISEARLSWFAGFSREALQINKESIKIGACSTLGIILFCRATQSWAIFMDSLCMFPFTQGRATPAAGQIPLFLRHLFAFDPATVFEYIPVPFVSGAVPRREPTQHG